MNFEGLINKAGKTLSEYSPQILTGLGVAGVVSTAALAVSATFKAAEDIRREEMKDNGLWIRLGNKDRFLLVWKHYVPAGLVGATTIACIVGSNTISSRKQAALVGAYGLVQTSLQEYREKVAELHGAGKEQKVRDAIAQDRVTAAGEPDESLVILASDAEVLCMDSYTGQYFNSTVEKIRSAVNDINYQCIHEMSASMNDFYSKIGLPTTRAGDAVGWNVDQKMDVSFSASLTPDGKPCLVVNYYREPIANYARVW